MKLLALDIETAPGTAYFFQTFKTTIGIEQIITPPRMLAISWQWMGEKKVHFMSEHHDGREKMLDTTHALLDDADVVLHYNGNRFDLPWITGELLMDGYAPPAPVQSIDLYRELRKISRLPSGKLDYAAQRLLGKSKLATGGFGLWRGCMEGDEASWRTMKKYSIQDTALLLPLYERIRPYIKVHPNVAVINSMGHACPRCSGTRLQRRGSAVTSTRRYQRYQCLDCSAWSRGAHSTGTTELR